MPLYTHIITYVSLSLYLSVSLDISISICTSLSLLHSTSKLTTHPRPSENSIPATGVIQIALLQPDNASVGYPGSNLQWWFKIPQMRYLRTQWSTHWPEMDWIKTYWSVVSTNPSEKYDFVRWDDDIPNWMESHNPFMCHNHQQDGRVVTYLTIQNYHFWPSNSWMFAFATCAFERSRVNERGRQPLRQHRFTTGRGQTRQHRMVSAPRRMENPQSTSHPYKVGMGQNPGT
jgi:hypothetical protein